jgi:hypothetical protein
MSDGKARTGDSDHEAPMPPRGAEAYVQRVVQDAIQTGYEEGYPLRPNQIANIEKNVRADEGLPPEKLQPASREEITQMLADIRVEHAPAAMKAALNRIVEEARQHLRGRACAIAARADDPRTRHLYANYSEMKAYEERGDVDAQLRNTLIKDKFKEVVGYPKPYTLAESQQRLDRINARKSKERGHGYSY